MAWEGQDHAVFPRGSPSVAAGIGGVLENGEHKFPVPCGGDLECGRNLEWGEIVTGVRGYGSADSTVVCKTLGFQTRENPKNFPPESGQIFNFHYNVLTTL